MESPQRDPRPTTLPTTSQEGPGSTPYEPAYHIPILRMGTLHTSPIIALKASSYPILASPIHAGPDIMLGCPSGRPYLAVLGTTLGLITRHRAGQYCTTEIRTVSRHLCPITTHIAKIKKIAKCHIPYTANYPILPYLSASFTSALPLHIDTR